jgi:uncharacterized protein (UPF0248 family)
MVTIRALLDRIRWDPEFGRGEFVIGYYDRVEKRTVLVPLAFLDFDPHDHLTFRLTDASGTEHSIPLHRVCAVYRDGECIWRRERC